MAEADNEEKLVEKYKKELEKAKTIDVLETLGEQIDESELSESRKKWFKNQIGRKKGGIGTEVERYKEETNHLIKRLPVDEVLARALKGYLITEGLAKHPVSSWRRYYRRYVEYLINWVYKNVKHEEAPVSIADLDSRRLTSDIYSEFLNERFKKSDKTRWNAKSYIAQFGEYLNRSGYGAQAVGAFRFPEPTIRPPKEKRKASGEEEHEGVPRTKAELDKIMSVVGIRTPKLTEKRADIYRLKSRVILQSGLRYSHLVFVWRVKDIAGLGDKSIVEDVVFNKKYYKIPAASILDRERDIREQVYSKIKEAAEFVYLSTELVSELMDFVRKWNLDSEDFLFDIPLRTFQHRAESVSEMTGIEDFTFYDFRATFASALFNTLGTTPRAKEIVRTRGGWGSDSTIPFQHYITLMTKQDGIDVVRAYDIYVDVTEREEVEKVLEGEPVEVSPEKYASLEKRVEELTKMVEELKKRE